MEIVKNFGLDPVLLGAQIVNFLIILFLLKRLLYKPMLKILKERQEVVKDGIKKTEEARLLLEKTQEEERKILKDAQSQASKILTDAQKQVETVLRNGEESAKKQTERLLKDARDQILIEAKETEDRLTENISKISVDYLKRALSELFTEKDQKSVLDRALKQLKQKTV